MDLNWGVVEDSVWEKSFNDVLLFSPAQSLFLTEWKSDTDNSNV